MACASEISLPIAEFGLVPTLEETHTRLVTAFLAHGRVTPQLLTLALREAPQNAKLHAVRALMLVLLGRDEVLGDARAAAARARLLFDPGDPAAQDYCAAADRATRGSWRGAIAALEGVLARDPDDAMAAKLSHALRFMLGDKLGMLGSIERVLKRMSPGHPPYGFMLGCKAFALEENGFYADAERIGREAVERERADAWGFHAVSHVHEMSGRVEDGTTWLEQGRSQFSRCNNFAGHLFWHLALFRLEKGEIAEVFALYDREIRKDRTDDFRDIANAASLLMRLELDGHDVGERWEELGEKAEKRVQDRAVVFADLHYMLALIGAGKFEKAAMFLAPAGQPGDQAETAREVGGLTAQGVLHFANGNHRAALDALLATRSMRAMLGGSDAQRDIFEQILIESALKAGEHALVKYALEDRLARRGQNNRFAKLRLERLERRLALGAQKNRASGLALALSV